MLAEKVEYDEKDEYVDWKNQTYTLINSNNSNTNIQGDGATFENGILNITKGGIYVLEGKLNGSVLVNTEKTEDVRLVFNGVQIKSDTTAPIQVYQANKVIISLEENTENFLEDETLAELSKNKDGDEITATIYSKDDLIINGLGSLIVNANTKDGITSKDDLIFISGNITINATDDALVGKDSVQIKNANINIKSNGDGIKASNDVDAGEGYVLINGGNIQISSGDDGIKGEQQLIIANGKINIIESMEAIESRDLIFAGGDINVTSTDDGINAAGGNTNSISFLGGNILVDSQADGIDANGNIEMSGGIVTVYGPTNNGNGAIDYDGVFNITGEVLNISGSAGMAQATSNTSTQNTISYTFESNQAKGTKVELKNINGEVLAEITPTKTFQNIVLSNPNIKTGEIYTIFVNNAKESEITVDEVVTHSNIGGDLQTGGFKGQRPPEPPGGFNGVNTQESNSNK